MVGLLYFFCEMFFNFVFVSGFFYMLKIVEDPLQRALFMWTYLLLGVTNLCLFIFTLIL